MQSTQPRSLPVFQTKGAGWLGLGAGACGLPTDPAYQLRLPAGSPISRPLQAQPPLGALGLTFLCHVQSVPPARLRSDNEAVRPSPVSRTLQSDALSWGQAGEEGETGSDLQPFPAHP